MNEAIKLAIEKGGYRESRQDLPLVWDDNLGQAFFSDGDGGYYINNQRILLDPLFWQALGKALGWIEEGFCENCNCKPRFHSSDEDDYHSVTSEWKHHWHRFIDWIAEGKDADKFFRELLHK